MEHRLIVFMLIVDAVIFRFEDLKIWRRGGGGSRKSGNEMCDSKCARNLSARQSIEEETLCVVSLFEE